MENEILIIGYFGYITNQIDGQTIKTREVFQLLKSKYSDNINFYDTQRFKKSKLSLIQLFYLISVSKTIIYLPGKNSLSRLLPFIFPLIKARKKKLLLIAVGGWLNQFLAVNKKIKLKLKYSEAIFVESYSLQKVLKEEQQLSQTVYFPNFRQHNFTPDVDSSNFKIHNQFRVVFMARIMEEKGIFKILDFAEFLIKNNLERGITIDFFGPIVDRDKSEFEKRVNKYVFVNYKGIIAPSNVYAILSSYDLLLLPTHYEGEGFPGTILDSYISGVPVIASNWKFLPEYIDEGKTGFVFNTVEDLFSQILFLKNNPLILAEMKVCALKKSHEFSSEAAFKIIKPFL